MPRWKYRCCLCPAANEDGKSVCTPCQFVKQYTDERGWMYFVRAGMANVYKAFYRKPDKPPGIGEHGYQHLPWRESFDKAQEDLNELALSKGWISVES